MLDFEKCEVTNRCTKLLNDLSLVCLVDQMHIMLSIYTISFIENYFDIFQLFTYIYREIFLHENPFCTTFQTFFGSVKFWMMNLSRWKRKMASC